MQNKRTGIDKVHIQEFNPKSRLTMLTTLEIYDPEAISTADLQSTVEPEQYCRFQIARRYTVKPHLQNLLAGLFKP
jgi:hypothetical protein